MRHRVSPTAKVHGSPPAKVVPIPESMVTRFGEGMLLVPSPREVEAIIWEIPAGQVRRVCELRKELAQRHGAQVTCPLCFSLFWALVADAAEESRAAGHADVVPYWRVIRDDGLLNAKLPGGAGAHAAMLRDEGHDVDLVQMRVVAPVAGAWLG